MLNDKNIQPLDEENTLKEKQIVSLIAMLEM